MQGMASRPRSAVATRAAILEAARARFSRLGYERTTVRGIAADVGVHPSLLARYFDGKEGLFAEVAAPDLHLPDLCGLPPEQLAAEVVRVFDRLWRADGSLLPLLRASASSDTAARMLTDLFIQHVQPTVTPIVPDQPVRRGALFGAYMLGVAMMRFVVPTPPLDELTDEELAEWVAPVLARILLEPL